MQRHVPSEFTRQGGSIDVEKAIDAGHDARSTALKAAAVELGSVIRAIGTAFAVGRKA